MPTNIAVLPGWKKNSTPGEWLSEVSGIAYECPEKFGRIVVVYERLNEKGHPIEVRWQQYAIETNEEVVGMLETAKLELYDFMKGRR